MGYCPRAVSPESISASLPSSTALATSEASARVGRGFCVMDSSICVAVITGTPRVARARDNLLLHHGHDFRAHLHAEIAARDHHAIGNFENRVQIRDGLRLFELGDDWSVLARASDGALRGLHILRPAHKTYGDIVDAVLQRETPDRRNPSAEAKELSIPRRAN